MAEGPAMDGTATSGATVEEALAMARELIESRIAVHRDYGDPVPLETVPAQLHHIEITAPGFPPSLTQPRGRAALDEPRPLRLPVQGRRS